MSARDRRLSRARAQTLGGARFVPVSCNEKLARLKFTRASKRDRRSPLPPFISSTDVSIKKTCGDGCLFKDNGCWAQSGYTRFTVDRLDESAQQIASLEVIKNLVTLINDAFGGGDVPQDGKRNPRNGKREGRDLRLMNFGDFVNEAGARLVAGAAARWLERGGGRVFGFTHLWRRILRTVFGPISMLASVETAADVERARARGYTPALVVDKFPNGHKSFRLPGSTTRFIPCPGETQTATRKKRSCVDCRLCMDADMLYARNVGIAFAAHGPGKQRVREQLVPLRAKSRTR